MLLFMCILGVFVIGWAITQYSLLYPDNEPSVHHILSAFSIAYFQMFGNLFVDSIIKYKPMDTSKPDDRDWCTKESDIYSNYTQMRCPDETASSFVYFLLMVYLSLTTLLLFNLLIAVFSNTYTQIQGLSVLPLLNILEMIYKLLFSYLNFQPTN